jgi:hypothetical protein
MCEGPELALGFSSPPPPCAGLRPACPRNFDVRAARLSAIHLPHASETQLAADCSPPGQGARRGVNRLRWQPNKRFLQRRMLSGLVSDRADHVCSGPYRRAFGTT